MADILEKLFIDVTTLPHDGYGFIELLYLGATYAFVLITASNMIKDGSEMLLLIPKYAGVVGSIVLPVLGAVPDGAIVLFSGMGPPKKVAEQVTVGVGALAGSTIMLLTVPWFLAILAGRVNTNTDGTANYNKPKDAGPGWKKLSPPDRILGSCVSVSPTIAYTAKVMLITTIPYFVIQIPAIFGRCVYYNEERKCVTTPNAALAGSIVAFALFLWYLWDQARIANSDPVKKDKITQIQQAAIDRHIITIRGLFPQQRTDIRDEDGSIEIAPQNNRLRHFLRKYFNRFDADRSGIIDKRELVQLLSEMGEKTDAASLDQLWSQMDRDKSGGVDFDEFCQFTCTLLMDSSSPVRGRSMIAEEPKVMDAKRSDSYDGGDESEDDDEEDEMPADLVHLSPEEQQKRILRRSCYTMGIGLLLVVLFSDPAVSVFSEMGTRTGIPAFFIAFILAPMASNGSEVIAAYAYALKKTEKTMSISFASLLGAACMNNTFCMGIFLMLIYWKQLKWTFAAETAVTLVVQLCMFVVASRKVHKTVSAFYVLSLFPLSLVLVLALEAVGFD